MNRGQQQSHCKEYLKNEDGCQNLNLQCSKQCNEYLHMNASQKQQAFQESKSIYKMNYFARSRKEMIKRLQAALCFGIAHKKQPFPFKPTKSLNENSRMGDQGLRWRDLLSYYRANAEKAAQEQDKQNTETQRIQKRQKDNNKELDNTIRRDEHHLHRKDEKQQLFQSRLQQNQENSSVLKSHNCFGNSQWEQLVQHKAHLFGQQSAALNDSALKVQFENQQLQAKLRQHEQNIIFQQHLQRNIVRNKSSNRSKVVVCSNRSSSLQAMNTTAIFNQKQQNASQQQSKQLGQNQFDQPCIQSPRNTPSSPTINLNRNADDNQHKKQHSCNDELERASAGLKQEVNIKDVPSKKDLNIIEEIVQKQIKNTLENLLRKERNDWEKALCEIKEQFAKRLSCMEETISQNSEAIKAINDKFESLLEQNKHASHSQSVKEKQQQITPEQQNLVNICEQPLFHLQQDYCNDYKSNSQPIISTLQQSKTFNNSCQAIPQIQVIEQLISQPILPGSTQPTNQSPRSNIEIPRNTIPNYCPYLQASSSNCLKATVQIIPMTHSFSSSSVLSPDNMHGQSLISFQSSWMNQPLSAIHNCSADSLKPNDLLYTYEQLSQQQQEQLPIYNSALPSSNPTQSAQSPLYCLDQFTEFSKYPNEFSQFQNKQSCSPKKSLGQLASLDSSQNKVFSTLLPETTTVTNLITPAATSHHPGDTPYREQHQQQPLNSPKNMICEQENEEEFILYQLDEKGNLLDETGKPVVDEIGGHVSFSEYQINRLRQSNILQDI